MQKRFIQLNIGVLGVLFISLILNSSFASAHRDGCHRWHSCPSDSGSYICGDLGYTSGCGSVTVPSQTPIPRIPVQKSTEVVTESVIKFKTIKKENSHKYIGYKKILTEGINGITTTKVVVQLVDDVEQSRSAPVRTVKQPATDEVIEVGVRSKPIARFTKIRDMSGGFMNTNKGMYIVEGFAAPSQKITLYQNEKKVGTTTTNRDGYFEFNKLIKGSKPSWLVIYDKRGNKGEKLSENTRATFTTKELITEYALLSVQKSQ